MKLFYTFIFSIISFLAFSQTEFDRPWNDTARALILDPYSANFIDFDKIITNTRLTAIIHKASEGLSKDKSYSERKLIAKSKGLLWGSYHLGRSGDPIKQADFYLSLIGYDSTDVIALDLEDVEDNSFMNIENAKLFVAHIKQKTGRYPIIYANHKVVKAISAKFDQTSIFAKCPLWYARFKNKVADFPRKVWKTYSIWQFTCEINCCQCTQLNSKKECIKRNLTYNDTCPYKGIEGIKCDMDVNIYNGSVRDLRNAWNKFGK